MSHRLLLVEQSATMRYVLEKHAESLGYAVDACESYPKAVESLVEQFQQFGTEYSGLLFGWPTTAQDDAAELALLLENSDLKDLPVVVMSADLRAETRAWVAGRDNTELLAWKEYQGLENHLQTLIDAEVSEPGGNNTMAATLDNSDVRLLIVDDSATIRHSLRDLFQAHGYSVTLAATAEEAVRYAAENTIDIAVLDFYLAETTGDVLCQELLASEQTGDIVCTILTGTYSDHIIKRSLRAGAVECMFKNESSELLLGRIDAISRFVCKTREMRREQRVLEDVVDCIAGAIVLLDAEDNIIHINAMALEQLGWNDKSALIGQPSHTLLESGGPAAPGTDVHAATWKLPDGGAVDVDYQHSRLGNREFSLLRFTQRSVPIANAEMVVLQQASDPSSIVESAIRKFDLKPESGRFLTQMLSYLVDENDRSVPESGHSQPSDMLVSLLVLDVFIVEPDRGLISIAEDESLAKLVCDTMEGIHARNDHVAALSDNRFGFLMRHAEESQAYVITRKVMQRCLEISANDELPKLACTASLLGLTKNAEQPMSVLIQHTFKGMDLVNTREPNQAILLDVRRLLSAYPATTE
ncbi:MAG: response regulator [Granulosicoccus sp.]